MILIDKLWCIACATITAFVCAPVFAQAQDISTPILVELFTSEGCSSCPPADRLLNKLDHGRLLAGGSRVITLSEHVDYWDYLGWRDPFASAVFSARQRDYCAHFGVGGCYTPQIVIDGNVGFVGSDGRKLAEGLSQAAPVKKSTLVLKTVKKDGDFIATLSYLPLGKPQGKADLYVAVVSPVNQSKVTAGENSGQVLEHADVALELKKLAAFESSQPFKTQVTVKTKPEWQNKEIYLIGFIQMQESKKVIAVNSEN